MGLEQTGERLEGRDGVGFGCGWKWRLDAHRNAPAPGSRDEHRKQGRSRTSRERDRARWEPPGFAIDLNDDVSPGWPTECDDRDDFFRRQPVANAAKRPEFRALGKHQVATKPASLGPQHDRIQPAALESTAAEAVAGPRELLDSVAGARQSDHPRQVRTVDVAAHPEDGSVPVGEGGIKVFAAANIRPNAPATWAIGAQGGEHREPAPDLPLSPGRALAGNSGHGGEGEMKCSCPESFGRPCQQERQTNRHGGPHVRDVLSGRMREANAHPAATVRRT